MWTYGFWCLRCPLGRPLRHGEFGNEAITKKSAVILANEETEMQYEMSHLELDS